MTRPTLIVRYVDAKGRVSERPFTPEALLGDSDLMGFCHLRRSVRTLKIHRITSAVEVESGEVIGDFAEYMRRQLR